MTNDVSTNVFGGAVAMTSAADLADRMEASASKDPRGSVGDSDYLNFSGKRGSYSIGADGRAITEDEWWVVNIGSFEDGYICWKNGKPAATRMANFCDAAVPAPDPEEGGPFEGTADGWFQAKAMTLKSIDNGDQGYFKINSKSGVAQFADLQRKITERAKRDEAAWPVIGLGTEEFTAGGYKNLKPSFLIAGWLTDEQVGAALLDPDADVEALMAANEAGAVEASEPAPEPEPKAKPRAAGKARRGRSARI